MPTTKGGLYQRGFLWLARGFLQWEIRFAQCLIGVRRWILPAPLSGNERRIPPLSHWKYQWLSTNAVYGFDIGLHDCEKEDLSYLQWETIKQFILG